MPDLYQFRLRIESALKGHLFFFFYLKEVPPGESPLSSPVRGAFWPCPGSDRLLMPIAFLPRELKGRRAHQEQMTRRKGDSVRLTFL